MIHRPLSYLWYPWGCSSKAVKYQQRKEKIKSKPKQELHPESSAKTKGVVGQIRHVLTEQRKLGLRIENRKSSFDAK